MALQTARLVMIGLGVQNDAPPDPIQPKLVDGIHLRWAFQRELGFPWYGFSIFRRVHREGKPVCLSDVLKVPSTPLPVLVTTLSTPLGELVSDRRLRFTDDFPPLGSPEVDLDGRKFLRLKLVPSALARRVLCTIGFRGGRPSARECVSFLDRKEDKKSNPRREGKMRFEVRDARNALAPATHVVIVGTTPERMSGLNCGHTLTITLPTAASSVELLLTHFATPGRIEALDRGDSLIASAAMQNPAREPERIILRGRGIRKIVVHAPQNETVLHEVCFSADRAGGGKRTSVRVAAFLATVPVAEAVAVGVPGEIVSVELEADAISRIDIDQASAALIDLCIVPVAQGATVGWEPLQGFPYALSLPVTHPNYPASGNQPVNAAAAQASALGRVLYGAPAPWGGPPFTDLHAELVRLVEGGPGSAPPMAEVLSPDDQGIPEPPDPGQPPPTMTARRTLDVVLLAALNPAVAQMLGLYWVDRTATPGVHYDYLGVADYSGAGHAGAAAVLTEINANGFARLEGYIVFDKVVAPAPALAPPTDLRAYALPGSVRVLADGTADDASNNAGLRWHIPSAGSGILVPGAAVMYHVWRAELGNGNNPSAAAAFAVLTAEAPVLVIEPLLPPGESPERADDWPPFPLHFLDQGLAEGWYGYRVAGLDIFGRLSPESVSAAWYEWTPVPEPRPWYYTDPPGDYAIHPSAVRLLDKIPPPPPTGIEAFALDPDDPFLLQDVAYTAWQATVSTAERDTLIGLRVRWQWTQTHMRQAPDTKEFRIYYQDGRLNALTGAVTAVTAASSLESNVTSDIANAHGADAYAGAHLRIGNDAYPIMGSDAGTPLQVRVRNLGLTETAGTVTVVSGSAAVAGGGTAWHAGMTGLQFLAAGDALPKRILAVTSPTQLTLESVYGGASGAGKAYAIFDRRPAAPSSASVVVPAAYAVGSVSVTNGSATVAGTDTVWRAELAGQIMRIEGDPTSYRVQAVVSPTQLTLNKSFAGPTASGKTYAISFPIFTDYGTTTSWQQRYYVVDYTAHVTEAMDDDGAPLRRYEVLLPATGDADRAGVPLATSLTEPIAYAHVSVSASDDKTHTPDAAKWTGTTWGGRTGNEGDAGAPAAIYLVRRVPPDPPTPPPPDSDRVFATPADYHSHSYYTFRWVAQPNLKTHVFRALDDAIFKTDWALRPRVALAATELAFFPAEAVEPQWSEAKRQEVADKLNQLNPPAEADPRDPVAAAALYRALSNDALRVLAGLAGNERAFVQLTVTPLDPADPATADRRGPDSDANYVPDPALRIYIDALDGRSSNRYFYRAAYVDGASNRSELSISGPPVWLPDVVPPRAPVITKVLGGEQRVTLSWASNREPDLAEYRVHRAESREDARDPRFMTRVHVEGAIGEPAARPAEVGWDDKSTTIGRTYWYRLTAADTAGNESQPSTCVQGKPFRTDAPPPPTWANAAWRADGTMIDLQWTPQEPDLRYLVRRRRDDVARWTTITDWLPDGSVNYADATAAPGVPHYYQIKARDAAGNVSTRSIPRLVPPL